MHVTSQTANYARRSLENLAVEAERELTLLLRADAR
jgi:hypothetical protein